MTPFPEVFAMTALFLLRLGVPLAITGVVTWWLKTLDAHWQAEAEARRAVAIVSAGQARGTAFKAPQALQLPCWVLHKCGDKQHNCTACKEPELPCWMAKLRSDGRLPSACYGCALFRLRPRLEAVPL